MKIEGLDGFKTAMKESSQVLKGQFKKAPWLYAGLAGAGVAGAYDYIDNHINEKGFFEERNTTLKRQAIGIGAGIAGFAAFRGVDAVRRGGAKLAARYAGHFGNGITRPFNKIPSTLKKI
jgi:hypothetical protein